MSLPIKRWRSDPVSFITEALVDPETGQPFVLNWSQRAFLSKAFERTANGKLRYPELCYSGPKKSGKTTVAAWVVLTVTLILAGRNAEAYCVANDLEQATGRAFAAIRKIVELVPFLRRAAKITESKITFPETGATITALASDYASAAGSNANIVCFDELWAYTSERSRRLWDEMIPPPTRKVACRLTTTYAGFEGESALLEDLYKRGLAQPLVGEDLHAGDGLLMAWHHEPVAPWQTPEWVEQMRSQMRPNAFLRMIENRFVSSESTFVDLAWWDACVDHNAAPIFANKSLPIWVGVDASVKRDSTAIVAVTWDKSASKVRLITHRVFQPTASSPLDFERTIVPTIFELRERFSLRAVYYDPFQMAAVAQRLSALRVPMREYPQTPQNLTDMGSNLYELVRTRGIVVYSDDAMRLAISRAVAKETSRGFQITKEKASHKIDAVVALAMATLACVEQGPWAPALVGPIVFRADGSEIGSAALPLTGQAAAAATAQHVNNLIDAAHRAAGGQEYGSGAPGYGWARFDHPGERGW